MCFIADLVTFLRQSYVIFLFNQLFIFIFLIFPLRSSLFMIFYCYWILESWISCNFFIILFIFFSFSCGLNFFESLSLFPKFFCSLNFFSVFKLYFQANDLICLAFLIDINSLLILDSFLVAEVIYLLFFWDALKGPIFVFVRLRL